MAGEVLRYLNEILEAFADNVTGDISALDGRDGWIFATPTSGDAFKSEATVIPAGTDVNVNTAVEPTYRGGQGFILDELFQFYTEFYDVEVRPGYQNLARIFTTFTFASSTNETTDFWYALDGIEIPSSRQTVSWVSQSVPFPVVAVGTFAQDVSAQPKVSLRMTKATGTAIVSNLQQWITGTPTAVVPGSAGILDGLNHPPGGGQP